jgi:hypothetical protein
MAKPVVLAAHGITGTGVSWNIVRDQLGDDVTFIAPDLGAGARLHPGARPTAWPSTRPTS